VGAFATGELSSPPVVVAKVLVSAPGPRSHDRRAHWQLQVQRGYLPWHDGKSIQGLGQRQARQMFNLRLHWELFGEVFDEAVERFGFEFGFTFHR